MNANIFMENLEQSLEYLFVSNIQKSPKVKHRSRTSDRVFT